MIHFTQAHTDDDLAQIAALQVANLPKNLSPEEVAQQGFVTIDHGVALLKKMNEQEKHVVAKDGTQVIGYLLAMTEAAKHEIPVLFPMFEVFNNCDFGGRKIAGYRYLVVGQVCMAKTYRGQGILDQCYAAYRDFYAGKYDFAITEIDLNNPRSLKAHKRIGFEEALRYRAEDGHEWVVVIWDWRDGEGRSQ